MDDGETFTGPIGSRTGAVVFSVMGVAWWLAASGGVPSPWTWLFLGVGLALGIATAIATFRGTRNAGPMDASHIRRGYNLINLAQLAAIFVTVLACVRAERQELIAPLVAAVVGVHFLPFRRLFQWSGYGVVGGLFVLVALAGLASALFTSDVEMALLVTGSGAALVLWGAAWFLRAAD